MKIKNRETIYEGFYTYRKLTVEDKGETFEREILDIGSAAAALVYDTKKEKYILVKQYRFGAASELLEIVAGIVDNEQGDPEMTIRKEIEEETGYAVDQLEHIWDFYPSAGATTERLHLYYAEVSSKKAEGGGLDEEHEDIAVLEFSLDELLQLQLPDAKTIIAVQWLARKKGRFLSNPEVKI
ncbi:ADP-ribose pyrophosphatase [Flammeovirgaceae bacterium 311]|nr:ADP-ribose pyrophosphatase [Flammeovirgaceae bacterium 311]